MRRHSKSSIESHRVSWWMDTIDDPKAYTRWQVKEKVRLVPDSDIIESACENNRDLQHLGGKFSR